jgi:hypothetical protein
MKRKRAQAVNFRSSRINQLEHSAARLVLLCAILAPFSALLVLSCSGGATQQEAMTGGRCDYRQYRGTAEIVSLTQVGSAMQRAQDEFEVGFVFHPEEVIEEQFAQVNGKVFLLQIDGGANPNRLFIQQQDIRKGKRVGCVLKAISRGACTPMIFVFPWNSEKE